MAVVAIKGGMEEMVGWIDRIECCFCVLFFFGYKMKSTIFFDTGILSILFIVGFHVFGIFWCVPRCK